MKRDKMINEVTKAAPQEGALMKNYSLLAKIMKLHMEKTSDSYIIYADFLGLGTPGRFRRSQPRTTSTNFWSVVSLVPLLPKLA